MCPVGPAKEPFSHEAVLLALGVVAASTLFLWLVYACWPSFGAAPTRPESLVTSPYSPYPDPDAFESSAVTCWCRLFGLMEGKGFFCAAVFFSFGWGFMIGGFGKFCILPLSQYKNVEGTKQAEERSMDEFSVYLLRIFGWCLVALSLKLLASQCGLSFVARARRSLTGKLHAAYMDPRGQSYGE